MRAKIAFVLAPAPRAAVDMRMYYNRSSKE